MTPAPTRKAANGGSDVRADKPAADLDPDKLRKMAAAIRALSIDAVEAANSGHPGLPLGAADIATVLFAKHLSFDPTKPDWPNRDRFVLSAGHGSMLLYAALHLLGYEDMPIDEIRNFRQLGSRTAGHPEFGAAAGIETTTGPLGQGIATAVGMAIAERHLNAEYGEELFDHRTYVLASDGDLMEGISHEAISLAGHLKLSKLIVLFDDNDISIDGALGITETGDQLKRFEAAGWQVQKIDGHDPHAIHEAILAAQASMLPSLIACRTTIGFGAPNKQGTSGVHGSPLGGSEAALAKQAIGWTAEPFEVPADVRDCWRVAGLRGVRTRKAWEQRLEEIGNGTKAELERRLRGDLPAELAKAIKGHTKGLIAEPKSTATRKASGKVLEVINAAVPETVGGSADLTGSVNTLTKGLEVLSADNYAGRYIHYGVREHAMAAAMNGMALHGGVIPYAGTFLVFSDYCRPAMRLSALMHQRVVYVMTHDSIGLGEDGPTHQPVEHLAALRAIPNMRVLRPADAVETAECWQLALEHRDGPSVLVLTRQDLPQLRLEASDKNLSGKGAYILAKANGDAAVTLLATGSEVHLALAARQTLEADGVPTTVVSMPCWDLFETQPERYRDCVIDPDTVRIAVEAASPFGWERYVGRAGAVVGMRSFGASGPYDQLYEHFGITAEAVVSAARQRLLAE